MKIISIDFVDNELGQTFGLNSPNTKQYALEGADVRVINASETSNQATIIIVNPMAGRSLVIHLK